MASTSKGVTDDSVQNSPKCAYCKRYMAKITVKCGTCPKVFHSSCGTKFGKCCDRDLMVISVSDKNSDDLKTTSESDVTLNPKSPTVMKDFSSQDFLMRIISELEGKNSILIENAQLLKYKISILEREIIKKDEMITELNVKYKTSSKKHSADNNTANKHAWNNQIDLNVSNTPAQTNEPSAQTSSAKQLLNGSDVNKGFQVMKTKTVGKERNDNEDDCNSQISNKLKDSKTKQEHLQKEDEWKVVDRKYKKKIRKALVTGNFSGQTNVEGVEKLRAFHVTNLKPTTTADELKVFLDKNFTEVKCEALVSKFPEAYASFKVMLPSREYEKAMDGKNWPNKASIHHFFHRKSRENQNR